MHKGHWIIPDAEVGLPPHGSHRCSGLPCLPSLAREMENAEPAVGILCSGWAPVLFSRTQGEPGPSWGGAWWTPGGLDSRHLYGQRWIRGRGPEPWGLWTLVSWRGMKGWASLSRAPPWLPVLKPRAAHSSKAGPGSAVPKTMGRPRAWLQSEQRSLGGGVRAGRGDWRAELGQPLFSGEDPGITL